jgi:ubiquinone/menaquinone biosynthesis C-methylase UbiE
MIESSDAGAGVNAVVQQNKAKPRKGPLAFLLDLALQSPLWELVLVPQARDSMVKTAEANGINWIEAYDWISSDPSGPWNAQTQTMTSTNIVKEYPNYYLKPFHGYESGNLCWKAAFEQELALKAVGARNFPEYGSEGAKAFRDAFDSALTDLGASIPKGGAILDMGCGTGMSTRNVANKYPQAKKVIGIDLSHYFIEVGKYLLDRAPKGYAEGGPWVTSISLDPRIELSTGDITNTDLSDESVDVVNLSLVIHELPVSATVSAVDEAYRLLKPGGQLWICEMDFDSPAYAAQRDNGLLFSLLRATEPFLDDYADGCDSVRQHIVEKFDRVSTSAATGRHFALVATKATNESIVAKTELEDIRFDAEGNYRVEDTHLKPWEAKK